MSKPEISNKSEIEAYIDACVARETQRLKSMIDSVFSVMEIREKAINMKLGALIGHDTRKRRQEEPVFNTLEEAAAYLEQMKKSGATAQS